MEGTDGNNNNEIEWVLPSSVLTVLRVLHLCSIRRMEGTYGNNNNDVDVVVAILCTDVSFCVVSLQHQRCGRPQTVSLGMPTHGAGWRCQLPMAM